MAGEAIGVVGPYPAIRHCERSEAIQGSTRGAGLLRCARNDGGNGNGSEHRPERDTARASEWDTRAVSWLPRMVGATGIEPVTPPV